MRNAILMLTICLLLGACASITDEIISPGRIQRDNLSNGLTPLHTTCKQLKSCQPKQVEIIGHGAASYRYYPMDIHKEGYVHGNNWSSKCKAQAKEINTLIDMAFSTDYIKAVEIDAQAPPTEHILCQNGKDCLFVMHNKPQWGEITSLQHPVVKYLQNNTVRTTLNHFIKKQYYKNRRLYLEIKSSFGCNAPNRQEAKCQDLPLRVANEIKDKLSTVNTKSNNQRNNWLTIVSFSATALQSVRKGLPDHLQDSVDYALIAGVHPFSLKWFFGQAKGSVPLFDDDLQHFATTTPWLDMMWFSAQGITKFSTLFQELATTRQQKCKNKGTQCKPLTYNVSTYPFSQKKLHKTLTTIDPPFAQPLVSMMIDVEDIENCR